MSKLSIHEVFKTQGPPTVTYVKRQNGFYEGKLSQALDSRGMVCLITGPSKTGKTSLYTKVLSERGVQPLRVRCNSKITADGLWRKALEQVDFARISEIQQQKQSGYKASGKLSGTIGWKWLAGLTGEAGTEIERGQAETKVRQKVLADPSPEHLVPVLREFPWVLVVEDFHYLTPDVQQTVFQQWKTFVDEEITVLVVGTTHHAADLAHANKDLVGRVLQIDMGTWAEGDLAKIASEGFRYLKLRVPDITCNMIAAESVGLPIITQATCLQLLISAGITDGHSRPTPVIWPRDDVYSAFHEIAKDRYQGFESIYDRLTRGPRKRARRYDTYELVLSTFTLDPLVFSLRREEITERLKELPITAEQLPPGGSLASTFNALGEFQRKLGIEILEWSARDQKLYIVEPAFLFFLRWRKARQAAPSLEDLLLDLIGTLGGAKHPSNEPGDTVDLASE